MSAPSTTATRHPGPLATATVHVIMPGDVADPAVSSGGNTYDLRLCHGLAQAGWLVHQVAARGTWPRPGDGARAHLAEVLAAVPDGEPVLLDGLVACGVPEVVVPEAGRLRLAVLVHLPLADETGLPYEVAAELDARERETLRAVAAVLATSRRTGRRLAEHHGVPADRVHVCPPGVDPAPAARGTDGATRLLSVAAVTPRKGHDVLVRALATLTELPWDCACVGALDRAPGHVRTLRGLIGAFGLSGRLRLAGPRGGAELAAAYADADLFVLPSRAETYGMVVTEALARGIPVLASDADGVAEALGAAADGDLPGMLVPPDDPPALASALRRWLTEPDLRDRLRTAARQRRATLDGWDATARAAAGVLDGLRGAEGVR